MTIVENYLEIRSKTLAFEEDMIPLRNRFAAFLLKNNPWAYVDYDLQNSFAAEEWLTAEDATPDMDRSTDTHIFYRGHEAPSENYFYMPVAFIDNPAQWEAKILDKMKYDANHDVEHDNY